MSWVGASFKPSHGTYHVCSSQALPALLGVIRDKNTQGAAYVLASNRAMTLLAEEAWAALPAPPARVIETPVGARMSVPSLPDPAKVVAVSIVRAGDTLLQRVRLLQPDVKVGKVSLQSPLL
jgi:uracil phosphoribosyltransferase